MTRTAYGPEALLDTMTALADWLAARDAEALYVTMAVPGRVYLSLTAETFGRLFPGEHAVHRPDPVTTPLRDGAWVTMLVEEAGLRIDINAHDVTVSADQEVWRG